ncbi:hypothetical protein JCM8097_008840 [Rhodosporidiobolus ruineniae]
MSDSSAASPAPSTTADASASGIGASAAVNGGPVESAPAKDSNEAGTAGAVSSAASAEDASAKINTNTTSASSAEVNGNGHSTAAKTEDLPVQPAKEDAVMQDASAPAASSASTSEADKLASREITPAPSEAVSDTGSASTSTPAPAEGITASAASEVNDGIPELPFPLSEYKFANTSLPVASTSTTPFFFQSNPAVQLDESWTRSKRSDDPAAWDEPDRDYGYFATPEELEASRVRENARKAKVQQRLRKLNLCKGKGREEELASPPPPPAPSGRGYPKARHMEKLASADGTAPTPPRRGRPPKSALQQQVKASPAPTPARAASPPAQRSPQKSPPAPRAPARPATRFERKLVDQLLPDDAQTATPIYLEPHPAFVDLYDLPPYYLPDGPVQPGPAPPPRQAAVAPAPAPSRQVSSAPAPTPAAAAPAPAPPPSFAAAAPPPAPPPAQAAAPAPTPTTLPAASALPALPPLAAPSPAPSVDDQWSNANTAGGAGANKRARGAEDDGKRTGRKKARESSIASNASGPGPDEPPLGPPVNWIVQSTTCLSKKVEGQVRCFQCIARSIGHGCSFNGVRSFGVDYLGRIVTAPKFRSTSLPDNTPYFDKKLTKPLSLHESELVKTWLAPHLKPIVKQEYRLSQLPTAIKIHHDLSMHRLCDHCNTAQVGAVYMCQKCGRMACKPCHDTLIKIEKAETMNTGDVSTIMDIQRRRKCIAKKRGKDATGAEIHRSEQFIPLTVFKGDDLFDLYKEISEWDRTRMLAATDPKTYAYLRRKFSVKSNLATYDINTHQVNTVEFEALTEPIYFELWRMGEPVLVRHVPRGGMARFSPKTIAERFPGNTKIDLVNNYGTDSLTSTASSFFSQFNEGDFRRVDKDGNISYRTKDFPNARHFRNELKDMIEEFWKILPLPNILHPNGIYNMLAHTPSNASQPDLGPRATCSWETNAKWSTTLLRTDCTDIASYMWWGGKDAETKKPLRVRWDVFKAEDADKLREFCFEMQQKRAMKPQTLQKYKETHDDPLLYPQMYLTKSMRLELFKKHGIQPFPIYQFEGDLVLVPAGCPYQVSSWVDHLSMTVSFLAGARAGEAVKGAFSPLPLSSYSCSPVFIALAVNKAFHDQTKERAAWRQDKVQLESQLLWAWRSMEAWENEHPEIVEEAAAAAAKAKEEEKAKKEAADVAKTEDGEAKTDGDAKKDDSVAAKEDVKPDVKEAAATPAPAQPQEDTPMANAAAALPAIPQPAVPAPPVIPAAPPAAPPAAAAPSATASSAPLDPSSIAAIAAGFPPIPSAPQAPPAAPAQPNGTA